jgi:hypothetical protein
MESKIKYYQTRHRLSIKQIAELREFKNIKIPFSEPRQKTLSSMSKVAELLRLSGIFKVNGLNFIPLKGPILSWSLHKDFFTRISNDLDILIQFDDLDKCSDTMRKEGYEAMFFDFPKTKNRKKLVLKINNQISFFHPQKKIHIEIHWNLIKYPIIPKIELNQLLKNNFNSIVVHGETFTVFNKELEFVYLVLHGALHAWFRLKWLHDIYAYSKDENLDWDKVIDLSKHFKAQHLVYQSLFLADKYWVLPSIIKQKYLDEIENINPFIKNYPLKRIARETTTPSGFSNWVNYLYGDTKYSLLLFSEVKYKISYLKRVLFREKEILILPDSLTFLYFVFRPINFIYLKIIGRQKKLQIK